MTLKQFLFKNEFLRLMSGILFCCILTLSVTGCGAKQETDGGKSLGSNNQTSSGDGAEPTRGRYVESDFILSDSYNVEYSEWSHLLFDGEKCNLIDRANMDAIIDMEQQLIMPGDSSEYPQVLKERRANQDYFTDMSVADNGARMYTVFVSDENSENVWYYEKYFMSADGVETPWDTVPKEKSANIIYGGDGYFYVAESYLRQTTSVLRVNSESGESEFLFEVNGSVGYMSRCGKYLLMDVYDKLLIYDLETKSQQDEDPILNELIADSIGHSNGNYSYGYLICEGEGDTVYVLTKKGLYSHVMYGSVSEQMIDGSLCSLSDIKYLFIDMYVQNTEGEMPVFYILYDGMALKKFEFDPQVPSAPNTTVTVYSLYNDDNIQRVISAYRTARPDVYINYEVGIENGDSVTRDDALKNLATRLAAKEGPDILIMDDLPYNSYAEKGVLADLNPMYEQLKTQHTYFDNIVGAFKQNESLYAIPMGFCVPVITGDSDILAQIHGAEDLPAALRNSVSEEGASKAGMIEEMTVLQCMLFSHGNSLTNEDGSLDRESAAAFLELCRQIYEADRENLTQEDIEFWESIFMKASYLNSSGMMNSYYNRASVKADNILERSIIEGNDLSIGLLGGTVKHEFNNFMCALDMLGHDYMLMPGEAKECLPVTMLGLNASSVVSEEAQEFVRYCLSEFMMNMGEDDNLDGIPINRDELVRMEENPKKDDQGNPSYEPYIWSSYSYNIDRLSDRKVELEIGWCHPEVYERYNAMLDSIDTVNMMEYMLRDTVMEEGASALNGERSVEETINAIEKKVQIYLSE